jgi:hypothetical protein
LSPEHKSQIERCEAEQRRIEAEPEGPLWLKALGWADWEAEKKLIQDAFVRLEISIEAIEQTLCIRSGTAKGGLLERIEAIERTLSGMAKDAEAREFASLMKSVGSMESLSRNR